MLFPLALIALCYGGGFGTMPAFATDVFGSRNSGTIYGAMLTAWSAGAIVGPMLISTVPYRVALTLIAALLAAAAVVPVLFNELVQLRIQTGCTRFRWELAGLQEARLLPHLYRRL